MIRFVHIAPSYCLRTITHNGICAVASDDGIDRGVYALPVISDFSKSHQWIRQARKKGPDCMCAVYFDLPEDAQVFFGHDHAEHRWMTASEAKDALMALEDATAYQAIVPHDIGAAEIAEIRPLPRAFEGQSIPFRLPRKSRWELPPRSKEE